LGALQLGVGYTTTICFYWQKFRQKVKFFIMKNWKMKWFWRFLNAKSQLNKKNDHQIFYI
jgi:hypothetical protein